MIENTFNSVIFCAFHEAKISAYNSPLDEVKSGYKSKGSVNIISHSLKILIFVALFTTINVLNINKIDEIKC